MKKLLWSLCGMCVASLMASMGGMAVAMSTERSDSTALPQHVVEVLDAVPAFYLVTARASAVTIRIGDDHPVAPVFLDPRAARNFAWETLAPPTSQQNGVQKVEVAPLGQLYELENAGGADGQVPFRVALIPDPRQLQKARELLKDPGFEAVPVFAARHSSSGKLMSTLSAGRTVIPLFLELDLLEETIDRLAETNQELAAALSVSVFSFSAVVADISAGELPAENVQFVIPRAASEYISSELTPWH